MSEDISEMINNVKKMVDSGNIPENIKELLKNTNNYDNSIKDTSDTPPKNTSLGNSGSSIDVETIMKMKSIIDNMNQNDDPRANLLYSLKPYLRESRKNKLDQYVNLLNMTKIANIMANDKKGNTNNGTKQ